MMPPVSSELCTNYAQARIADMIWHHPDGQRGAALVPRQHINLGSWISLPTLPTLCPFELSATDAYVPATQNANETVFILLETDLQPGESTGNVLMVR